MCFALLLLIPVNVNACDNRTLAEQRDIAGNINTLVEYRMVGNAPVFDITLTNVPGSVRVKDLSTGREYTGMQFTSNQELTIRDYSPGQTIRFDIMGYAGCSVRTIGTISLRLRPFNPFSNAPICEEAREFDMCNRWEPVAVTHDVFLKRVEEFIEKRNSRLEREELPNNLSTQERVLTFIGNNYIIIVGIVILIVLIIAFLQKTAMKKNRFDFKI